MHRFLTTTTLFIALAATSAFGTKFIPTARSEGKEKVRFDGKKQKLKCEKSYVFDFEFKKAKHRERFESQWRQGNGCGSEVAANMPTRKTSLGGTKEFLIQLYEHESGYYLTLRADVRGTVRSTDPLVLELADGTEVDLYPLRDRVGGEGGYKVNTGAPQGSILGMINMSYNYCALHDISEEQLTRLVDNEVVGVKQYVVRDKDRGKGGVGKAIGSDERGDYVEYKKTPAFKYSVRPRAYCLLKARE